jgi:GNAT superfamily N-acetyltransferase
MTEIRFETWNLDDSSYIEKFKQFHNTIFPNTRASKEWLEWYANFGFLDHEIHTRAHVAIRESDDQIVGTWCVEPKIFSTSEKNIKVGRCFSVGIHPELRRQNLFVRMSKYAIQTEKNIGQYEHILGFPQEGRPVIDAHLKSGWKKLHLITMLGAKPEITNSSLRESRQVLKDLSTSYEQLSVGKFVENDSYFTRRWSEHPENNYIILSTKSSRIVLKHYSSIMHVLSMQGEETNVTFLLNAARTLAFRHKCEELNAWCADGERYKKSLEDANFLPNVSKMSNIELMCVDLQEKTLEDSIKRCIFHQGIEEIY